MTKYIAVNMTISCPNGISNLSITIEPSNPGDSIAWVLGTDFNYPLGLDIQNESMGTFTLSGLNITGPTITMLGGSISTTPMSFSLLIGMGASEDVTAFNILTSSFPEMSVAINLGGNNYLPTNTGNSQLVSWPQFPT